MTTIRIWNEYDFLTAIDTIRNNSMEQNISYYSHELFWTQQSSFYFIVLKIDTWLIAKLHSSTSYRGFTIEYFSLP